MNGQNHIVVVTPLKFLSIEEFEKHRKSVGESSALELMALMENVKTEVLARKEMAKKLKEKGNAAFVEKRYDEAEKFYSEAIELNIGCRPLWTNRAACRNTMKKYEEAISDCDIALSIDKKCIRSIKEKGNALLGLQKFDEVKECYESLRTLGEPVLADTYLKKLHDIQVGI